MNTKIKFIGFMPYTRKDLKLSDYFPAIVLWGSMTVGVGGLVWVAAEEFFSGPQSKPTVTHAVPK